MESGATELQFRELRDLIRQLNKTIQDQSEQIAQLTEVIASLKAQLAAKDQELANKQEQIDYLAGKVFGKSSEKRSHVDPNQMTLEDFFNEPELAADPKAPEPDPEEETVVRQHTRRKKPTFEEKYGGLEAKKELIELPEEKQVCETCGTRLKKIGEKFVRKEFNIIPQQVEVIEYYEAVYKCPKCEEENDTTYKDRPFITSAKVPDPLIPHSMAAPSMVSMIACQKYEKSVPLNRQESMWEQAGCPLSRATMANWLIFCAENYLIFIFRHYQRELLARKYLMADETKVQVLKEPDRPATTDSYMWLYRTGEDGLAPILLYEYQETRKGQNAADFLKGFQGYLETDGYAGYNKVEGVTRCCCWAHARRKFWDAIPSGERNKKGKMNYSLPAVQGFEYIEKVFNIEKAINKRADFSYEKRYELRLQKEKPVLEAFWSWLEKQMPVKGSKFETAVNYAANQRTELMNYLLDGHCSLHNNASERLAKAFVIGRKNWLFADTPKGASASAVYYSIIETARENRIPPFKYLQFLLEHRPNEKMSDMELSKLAPWNEDVRKALAG